MELRPATVLERGRLVQLKAEFIRQRCSSSGLTELRTLRQDVRLEDLHEVLEHAFRSCGDDGALADLWMALEPEPEEPGVLKIAAALIRAERFEHAVHVLAAGQSGRAPDSQATWIHAVALASAGQLEAALPLLRASRAHSKGSDAHVLIARALLEQDDTAAAIAELELGATVAGARSHSVYPLLAQAYTAMGRADDAARALAVAEQAHAAIAAGEKRQMRLTAQNEALKQAWEAGRNDEVARLVEAMWPSSPPRIRVMLQEYRVALHQRAGHEADAAAAQKVLSTMKEKK